MPGPQNSASYLGYTPQPDAVAMARVQNIWDWYFNHVEAKGQQGQFDYRLMKDLKLIDARPEGRSVWELTIGDYLTNSHGMLHGGAAGLIFDMCTMSALGPLHKEGGWRFLGGLSRTLNASYIRGLPKGTTVHIDCEVIQAGRLMGMIRGVIRSTDGKYIYCTCEHHKVNFGPSEDMLEYEVKPKL